MQVISANAEQMFLNISPEAAGLPRYTGEMELTNHSAGSLTSQAYQKRWLRKEELLADAAEKSSIAAEWLGARPYPLATFERCLDAGDGRAFSRYCRGNSHSESIRICLERRCDCDESVRRRAERMPPKPWPRR